MYYHILGQNLDGSAFIKSVDNLGDFHRWLRSKSVEDQQWLWKHLAMEEVDYNNYKKLLPHCVGEFK